MKRGFDLSDEVLEQQLPTVKLNQKSLRRWWVALELGMMVDFSRLTEPETEL